MQHLVSVAGALVLAVISGVIANFVWHKFGYKFERSNNRTENLTSKMNDKLAYNTDNLIKLMEVCRDSGSLDQATSSAAKISLILISIGMTSIFYFSYFVGFTEVIYFALPTIGIAIFFLSQSYRNQKAGNQKFSECLRLRDEILSSHQTDDINNG